MKASRIKASRIAAYIKERPKVFQVPVSAASIRRFLDTTSGAVTVAAERVASIGKYLQVVREDDPGTKEEGPQTGQMLTAATAFFRMRPEKADQLRDTILGVYAFYAYSEGGKARVCKGAIRFFVDKHGHLSVMERQESVPAGGKRRFAEIFSGHFLFRKDSVIVIQRHKGETIPKFYILAILNYKDETDRVLVMSGGLLKIGDRADVFFGNIYMVRDDHAFDSCTMLNATNVPPDILAYLDLGEWTSADVFAAGYVHQRLDMSDPPPKPAPR
jgi:hypothetical protein